MAILGEAANSHSIRQRVWKVYLGFTYPRWHLLYRK